MRLFGRIFTALAAILAALPAGAYYDSRGHNLDSLERVVARWTPDAVDHASEQELVRLNRDYRNLMLGYSPINREKSIFYARKALKISQPRGWKAADSDALRYLGQHFYSREQFDSAMVYYKASLAAVDAMAAGAPSPTNPEGYGEKFVDDYYSALYGAIGNLYNMMDSIPQAMECYRKAGAIFDKYGWNESNSILWYNIGETWVDEGDLGQAEDAYAKAMDYAQASGDSLMIIDVVKGFGRLYLAKGKPWKSLKYLRMADDYYGAHPDYSPDFRTENLNLMQMALSKQKKQLAWGIVTLVLVLAALACAIIFSRRKRGAHRQPDAAADVPTPSPEAPSITDRERDILVLLAKAYTSKQIAEALFLSTETINWYRKKLLVKFDVANTPELVLKAKELGLI
ncbi:MAG: LuxR family transcriptional regulator [Bacteroidales bacterium]|nr:LuxR family transcriptional regulator [Bacteroidales bacterium]